MKKVSEYIVEVSEGYDRLTFTFKEIDKAASFIRTVSTHHLAVDDDKDNECQSRDDVPQPVNPVVDIEGRGLYQIHLVQLDIVNILVEQLQILFVGEVGDGLSSAAGSTLVDRNLIRFGTQGFVALALDVEVRELYGRDFERTGKAGNGGVLYRAGSAHPTGRSLHIHIDLGVVGVEIVGQLQLGVLQVFQVARSLDGQFQGNGLVGLDVGRADGTAQREVAYPTHERGRFTAGQRHHLDRSGIGAYRPAYPLRHPHGTKGTVDQLIGFYLKVELAGRDGNLARTLREEQALFQHGYLVVYAVVVLQTERGVLRQVNILYHKAFERGETVILGLYARSLRVQLDGGQHGLLLIYPALGEYQTGKQRRVVAALPTRATRRSAGLVGR